MNRFNNTVRSLFLVLALLALSAQAAHAQAPAGRKPDPIVLLAAAKSASGGAGWDALRTQHSEVKLAAAGLEGKAERWSDMITGQSLLQYSIGPIAGTAGFDGKMVWTQDGVDTAKPETAAAALELAANAAYRDKLAFWYPDRAKARIEYKERAEAEGRKFDVVSITPEGGRTFEFWISPDSKLIERLVEREAEATRTEHYSDRRDVSGVKIPFTVRTSRGDPRFDEVVTVQRIAYNEPLAKVSFALPVVKQELSFPAGRASVEVPLETLSGHLFVRVMLDGRGPFRMLFDAGGANVLSKEAAAVLAGPDKPVGNTIRVASTVINGVELGGQGYAVADIEGFLRRVEGLDDVSGVIGLEWMMRMPVRIDYARSRLTLFDPAQFKPAGSGTKVAVIERGRLPKVRGSIDGTNGVFEIDTGSRASLTLNPEFATKNDLDKRYDAKTVAIIGAGMSGPVRSGLARGKMLKLGEVEVANPVIAIPRLAQGQTTHDDVAGNVGFGIMRQFAVTYDLPNDSLYFERYINFGTPDIADRGGMWLERVADGYQIVDVVTAGPAAAAGLKVGDVIVEINGGPYLLMPLPALRDALRSSPGSRVRVKTAAGLEATVVLKDLV